MKGDGHIAPVIAFMGTTGTGKSTLVNVLLREELSPVDVLPSTPCPLIFRHGETFRAVFYARTPKEISERREFARRLKAPGEHFKKVEVSLPHPWLEKATLIDTPGIEAGRKPGWLKEVAESADLILYLFHQRGLGDEDRYILHHLKGLLPHLYTKLSFWINANYGSPDGSALKATRAALGEIWGREVPLRYLHPKQEAWREKFRLLLEVEAELASARRLEEKCREEDAAIPRQLKRAASLESNAEFLCTFWEIRRRAGTIISLRERREKLHAQKTALLRELEGYGQEASPPLATSAGGDGGFQTVNFALLKERLLDLLRRLLEDVAALPSVNAEPLKEVARSLAADSFFITIWGPFSAGKSTFANALLGEPLLPVQDCPTTPCLTHLHHAAEKAAAASFPEQVTLPLLAERGGEAYPCREEMAALAKWLEDPGFLRQVRQVEVLAGNRFFPVSLTQLGHWLEQTRNLFRPPALAVPRAPGTALTLARSLPARRAARAAAAVRLTFYRPRKEFFCLDDPRDLSRFRQLLTSREAMLLEKVEIGHPAEPLKLATFIDTPGLDSVHTRYLQLVGRWLGKSDVHLVFFNGRHVLSPTHRQLLEQVDRESAAFKDNCLLVVNFADVLSHRERERIAGYLRREIALASRAEIHFLSAREALKDPRNFAFKHLLRRLEQMVLAQRGEKILQRRLLQVREFLDTIPAAPLAKYRQELAEIQHMLAKPGGYRIWKTPASLRKG
ncbi:dynamin family protein [Desulfovirgula thermocuniculi]|uniref:dynamin family protein n=1 Tax=Desulfovirgula thermocuniculi TaxID=348842 RepID=UPI000485235C|nr:dynamin family protein [Desulfovirgula thermocuniculi]